MKVLIVNKFLYPNGGSETYIFELGKQLREMGHEVQYFGMEHEGRIVGNRVGSYTSNMDFHGSSRNKILYPFRILYSQEAYLKIQRVLKDFEPDVVHLNNFNFQLTPSVIYAVKKYEKRIGRRIKLVYTAHDYQLVCPNHLLMIPETGERCQRCLNGHPINCLLHRCIHNSLAQSLFGSIEGQIYRKLHTYRMLDVVICPSYFMSAKLETHEDLKGRTVMMHNFVSQAVGEPFEKEDYVLYFGRFCMEKGTNTLLKVCRSLPDIPFVFAGDGPMTDDVNAIVNVENRGFLGGEALRRTIQKARFTVFPSEWYENCPFSVMETQLYGTPVIASDLGGTSELLENGRTGILFSGGNEEELREKIQMLWYNREKLEELTQNCRVVSFLTVQEYCRELLELYQK